MTRVWFSAGAAPVPSMTRTCVSATTGALTVRNVCTPGVKRFCANRAAENSRTVAAFISKERGLPGGLAIHHFGEAGEGRTAASTPAASGRGRSIHGGLDLVQRLA